MTTPPPTPNPRTLHLLRRASPALLIVAAVTLGAYYLRLNQTVRDSRSIVGAFTDGFHPGWLVVRAKDLRQAAASGAPDDWNQMLLRAALARWKLRYTDPQAFDALMDDYEHGLWFTPARAEWESVLTEIDEHWRAARRSARPLPDIRWGAANRGDCIILRADGPPPLTAQLGTRLRVVVRVEGSGDLPASAPSLYWATNRAPGISASRRRLGVWTPLPGEADGIRRFAIDFDLGWEPAWLVPDAQVGVLALAPPRPGAWKVEGLQWAD